MPPTDPRELLKAYSVQQVTADQVMRGLASHKGFYVPALFAMDRLQNLVSEHSIIFSSEFDSKLGQLVLFTDAVAAHRADGYPLGMFSSAFSGAQIFAALDDRFEAVSINPCSPQEESWFIKREGFSLADLWGKVVELEDALSADLASDATCAKLAAHAGFLVLVNDQNLPIDVAVPGTEGRSAVAFTAPDRYEAFLEKRSEADRARFKKVAGQGAAIFKQFQGSDMSGVLVNFGTSPVVVPRAQFVRICGDAGLASRPA